MRQLFFAVVLLAIFGRAGAGDLCKGISFTKAQAIQGRWAYDSSCGYCHLYNLEGRLPGESANEIPSITVLNEVYLKGIDGNGGMTPSLISDKFFQKWKDEKAFADRVANATSAFPPKDYTRNVSELQIAAYILYVRCGKM